MATTEREIKLGFDRGLLESVESSLVPIGYSVLQKNWVPEPTGGVRARRGWLKGSVTGTLPANPYNVVGIGHHSKSAAGVDTGYHIAANWTGTAHTLYFITHGTLESGGTWDDVGAAIASTSAVPVAMASGLGYLLYTNPSWSSVYRWDTTSQAAIAGSPAGRCLAFHKNRFFTGGSITDPTRLWYSDIGSTATWGVTSYIDIGRDDGESILDIQPFEEGLLIAKNSTLHFMSGSTTADFAVNKLNTGGGMAGRCICITPYGAVIASQKEVYLWTGGGVDTISKPVETSYEITGDFVSTAYVDGVTYICDEGTGIVYCIAMADGTWWTEEIASAANRPAHVSAHQNMMLYGPTAGDVNSSLLNYRELPGTSRAKDFGTLTQSFSLNTPEMWLGGPNQAVSPRHLYIRLRQRAGTAGQTGITVTPVYDGTAQTTQTIATRNGAPVTFRERLDVGSKRGVYNVQYQFSQTVEAAEAALFDLEELVLAFNVEEVR